MKRPHRSAFTLTEILIVLGILSVLAAVLFAAVGRVRENGRRAGCLGNLKQLSLGLKQYLQDHDGHFSRSTFPSESLMPYVKNPDYFRCPSIPIKYEDTYGLTPWLNEVDFKTGRVYGRNESDIAYTATTVSFYEFTDKDDLVDIASTCGITEVGVRHFNGANYAFVDGHVKWLRAEEFAQLGCSTGSWDGKEG